MEYRPYAGVILGNCEVGELNKPQLITRWGQFVVKFGGFNKSQYFSHGVYGFLENGGNKCYAVRVSDYKSAIKILDGINDIAFVAAPGNTDVEFQETLVRYCENRKDRFAILDLPEELGERGIQGIENIVTSEYCAYHYPWLYVKDYYAGELYVPPSGHVAGLYVVSAQKQKTLKPAITDPVKDALSVKYRFSTEEHYALSLKGIKCIGFNMDTKLALLT